MTKLGTGYKILCQLLKAKRKFRSLQPTWKVSFRNQEKEEKFKSPLCPQNQDLAMPLF